MNKTFYLLSPPYKKANLLFVKKEIQESKLFKSLAFKLAPQWYIKLRKCNFLNLFLKERISVPNEETFLIYNGYDSKVFFYEQNGQIRVKRAIGGEYKEEDFLGYQIHWDFTLKEIPSLNLLKEILRNHWQNLKEDNSNIHGDFTHSNILVDENNKVSIIDKKEVSSKTPIINDLFYFFSYFLHRAKIYKKDLIYEEKLKDVFRDILKKDTEYLKTIDDLEITNFHFSKEKETFIYWKLRFKNFLNEIFKE